MRADTLSWIRYAEADYRQVLRNAEEPVIAEGVCNHAQQCVEKYLKSVLEEAGRPVPRIHDLVRLLEETKDLVPVLVSLSAEINQLSGLFIISRYPTVEGLAGDLAEEVEPAVSTTTEVRRLVRNYFGLPDEMRE